jgi:hypothetical protein
VLDMGFAEDIEAILDADPSPSGADRLFSRRCAAAHRRASSRRSAPA